MAILDVFANSFHDREVLDVDDFNTDKERITELEEQVAVLQEIIGTRTNGSLSGLGRFDSTLSPVSRGKHLFLYLKFCLFACSDA